MSFEQANKYPADLILYDTNPGAMTLDELDKVPTWRGLPAVKAGQLVEWQAIEDWNYPQYTKDIRRVIDGVRTANPRLV